MLHLAAIIAAALALIFYGFHLSKGVWTPEFLFLWSFFLELCAHHEKWPY